MIRRMVNGKSPRKSPRTKRTINKKSETSHILNAIDKLTQLELHLKARLEKIKKQKRVFYISLSKITSPRKL